MEVKGMWRATQIVRREIVAGHPRPVLLAPIAGERRSSTITGNQPLGVAPVCQSCNLLRGSGIPWNGRRSKKKKKPGSKVGHSFHLRTFPGDLREELKAEAARRGMTLTKYMASVLRKELTQLGGRKRAKWIRR